MDAMIDRMTLQLLARAGEIEGRKDIPVLQRLPMMIKAPHLRADWSGELMEQIHKPQNALMHQKIQERMMTEMTFLYANTAFDELTEYGPEVRQKKTEAFIYHLERLLKMEQELFLYFFGYRLTDDLPPQLWRVFCGDGRWGDERHMKGRNKGAASIKRMRLCYDKPIKKTINTITGST